MTALRYLTSSADHVLTGDIDFGPRRARWWFTDRVGGTSLPPYDSRNLAAHVGDDPSAVRMNRGGLERELAAGPLSWMGPVHGTDIVELSEVTSITPDVDGLATTQLRTPLVTLGADCVPFLAVAGEFVIAAHIGWRGFADGMSDALCAFLAARDIDPARATVILGPAICGNCYGIPEERADAISRVSATAVRRLPDGRIGADIRVGLAETWTALGATVDIVGPCTYEDQRFFSHRRDGVTGRQSGVIGWL